MIRLRTCVIRTDQNPFETVLKPPNWTRKMLSKHFPSMDIITLMQAALRVITAVNEQANPTVGDVELLKQNALPSEADLPLKDLAVAIIRRELERRTYNG